MTNLLEETVNDLKEHSFTLDDVAWVGCREFKIPVEAFKEAADSEYHAGYGAPEVAQDLIVVLKDGSWLERHDYDGLEWWEFKDTPREPGRVWGGEVALTVHQAPGASCGWEGLSSLCAIASRYGVSE